VIEAEDVGFVTISPFAQFGSVQGDFTAGAHGTFGIFGAGAASPPHTHSGGYYGVVVAGEMNNPFGTEASPPTLRPGSFWSVPADEQHITACLSAEQECRFFFHADSALDFFPIPALNEEPGSDARSIPVESLSFEDLAPYGGATVVWGDPAVGPHGIIVRVDGRTVSSACSAGNPSRFVPRKATEVRVLSPWR
jgi:hypothetical protein